MSCCPVGGSPGGCQSGRRPGEHGRFVRAGSGSAGSGGSGRQSDSEEPGHRRHARHTDRRDGPLPTGRPAPGPLRVDSGARQRAGQVSEPRDRADDWPGGRIRRARATAARRGKRDRDRIHAVDRDDPHLGGRDSQPAAHRQFAHQRPELRQLRPHFVPGAARQRALDRRGAHERAQLRRPARPLQPPSMRRRPTHDDTLRTRRYRVRHRAVPCWKSA